MVRLVSHMLITLNKGMGRGQKEVGYLQQHVKQNRSHKGESLLSNEAQRKRNIMYANEGNKEPILLSAACQLYQILSYLPNPSTVLRL